MPLDLPKVPTMEEMLYGHEKVKKPVTTPTQPPQPPTPPAGVPEYFPGYGVMRRGVEVEYTSIAGAAQAARDRANKIVQSPLGIPLMIVQRLFAPGTEVRGAEQAMLQAQREADIAITQMHGLEWKMEVLNTLPAYLALKDYKIESADDVLKYIGNSAVTDADRTWLDNVLGKFKNITQALPEDFNGSVSEAQKQLLDTVLSQPKLPLRAVHNLTVDELSRSFGMMVSPLPGGMTTKDARDLLSKFELSDEETKTIKDYITERSEIWAAESDKANLIRHGLLTPEAPQLTPTEFAKLLLVQPMMATVQLMDKYFNLVPRPIFTALATATTESTDLEELYNRYRTDGKGQWESYALAYNDWKAPWYAKLPIEMFFDPTTFIGLGVATALATKGGKALTKLGAGFVGTRIGPWVQAVEGGYIAGADAVFKGGLQVVLSPVKAGFWLAGAGYRIPKTLAQMSRNFARGTVMELKAVLERLYPNIKNLEGLTLKDIKDTVAASIKSAIERPTEGADPMVRLGSHLLEFNYLDETAAKKLTSKVAEDIKFDTASLTRLNDEVLNMFSGQGDRITAGNILAKLGKEQTPETVDALAAKLGTLRARIVKDATDNFVGDTAKDMWINAFESLEKIRYSNLASPITQHLQQAGRTASWVSRVADRVLYSAGIIAMERRLVMPFARWNLLFANFGPFNFLENMQRSFLGGADVLYPQAYNGVTEFNRLVSGLANAPYEMEMAERGMRRLEQAIIDPKTGTSAVFKDGKIPFITKQVKIGDRVVGKKINLYGQDFMITNMQDYNDMWEYLTTMQRAWDYQVHYVKALGEVAPDQMRQIVDIVATKHGKELRAITSLKDDVKDLERVITQDATVGPEAVRAHANIDTFEFERRQISKELGKVFDKCTDVSALTKRGIRNEVLDGTILRNIDVRMDAFIQSEREQSIAALTNQIDILKTEADNMVKAGAPATIDEFLGDMQNITAIQEAVGERIHDYRKLTELRAQKLTPGKAVDDFHVGSAKQLAEFMDTSEESINKMLDTLKEHSGKISRGRTAKPLSDTQLQHLTDIDSISRLETANMLSTRQRIAKVESAISSTARNKRDARFWEQQRAEKSAIWDTYDTDSRKFRNMRLDASRRFLNSVGKRVYVPDHIPEVIGELTPNHVAYLFGVTGDDLYRGLTRVSTHTVIRPKVDFIDFVKNQASEYAMKSGKTAADIGFTDDAIGGVYDQLWRNLGIEPNTLLPDSPTLMQMEEIRQELTRLHAVMKIPESDMMKWRQYVNGVADDVGKTPMYQGADRTEWLSKKELAMTRAREQHSLSYPTYDDANIIDETMRGIFPFWTYEAFRWRWIPRTFMRTPGTLTGLARFMEYTDGGYIPIPFTDLQLNLLRGSIWLGGLRSLWNKDFPEYYDAFPGTELIDTIGRLGFFPGIHVMGPLVAFGATGGKPELSQLAPPFVTTALDALRQLSPQHMGKVIDIIFPDRFRDYQTMLALGSMGYDADDIWSKKKQGIKLTPEEQQLWLKAEQKVAGIMGVAMSQLGLFRYRPQEYDQLRTEMRKAITDATGVSEAIQVQIDRQFPTTGKRFSDYFKLDIMQQKLIYMNENFRRWQGVSTSLLPSSWQMLEVKIRDYYEEVEKIYQDARYNGTYEDGKLTSPSIVELNRQWVAGEISPDQWKVGRNNILPVLSESVKHLHESPAYKDVPLTLDERIKWMQDKGTPVPLRSADQELLDYYYTLQPEYKYDWESGSMAYDYDTYYAKMDILLESVSKEQKDILLQRIQINWTPMEKLNWKISRDFFRAYRNIRGIAMATYTPEQQQMIRRFEVARGDERIAIQNIPGPSEKPGGENLIAGFDRKVREARTRLRILDPELDAWLYFFGTTDSFRSQEASDIQDSLHKQYMTKEMIQ